MRRVTKYGIWRLCSYLGRGGCVFQHSSGHGKVLF